jgi:hypothetical protein
LGRSEEQWRENLESEEEYHPIRFLTVIWINGDLWHLDGHAADELSVEGELRFLFVHGVDFFFWIHAAASAAVIAGIG